MACNKLGTQFRLLVCAIALFVLPSGLALADSAEITLDLTFFGPGTSSGGIWELFGRVDDTGDGVDGSFGFSAIRALIDGVDFGTNGDAVAIATDIGAINPVLTSGGPRLPVLMTAGGTLDIIYAQDISSPSFVVGFVGTTGNALIASGTFSPGNIPSFGDDDSGLTTDALFLDVFPGPFGNSESPDSLSLTVTQTIIPEPTSLALLACGSLALLRRRR